MTDALNCMALLLQRTLTTTMGQPLPAVFRQKSLKLSRLHLLRLRLLSLLMQEKSAGENLSLYLKLYSHRRGDATNMKIQLYIVMDKRTMLPIRKYKTRTGAERAMNKLNNGYGCYRYFVRATQEDA